MNKKILLSAMAMMMLLATGVVFPSAAQARDTLHRGDSAMSVSVDKYYRWHGARARHSSPYFSRDYDRRHYGHRGSGLYYKPHKNKPHQARKLLHKLDRRNRWADLAPHERKTLRRDLYRQKAHRKSYRLTHRRSYPYERGHRPHHDNRIGMRLEYDRWL